ncbi:MAG: TolC family protein [Thermodesulfobacteriota bacterium]|nr:TolC family protein [Thermodesulfobacteriota bacterium]
MIKSKAPLVLRMFLCFSTLIFLPAGVGLAQEEKIATLEESITEALANNWALRAMEEKPDQAEYIKRQARAEFLPKLSTSYGYTRLSEEPIIRSSTPALRDFSLAPKDNYQWKGTVTQPLFTGFSLISSYQLAKLGVDQSKMEVELEKIALALRVKEGYFGILESDKLVDVAKKAVEALESHVKVASSFYEVGMIPVNDLLKAEVELANAQHDLVKVLNASRLTRFAFNAALSRPIDTAIRIKDILAFKPETGEFDDYLEEALMTRPEMKLLDISILQIDQEIRLTKSKNYPEVALTYDYIKEGDEPGVSGSNFHDAGRWEAMALFTWTFWEWGTTHYSIKERESLKNELTKTKMALVDTIRLELKDALLDLDEAARNIPTTRKAVEQAEENLRVSQERYKAQVTTSTEVLDAQTLLTQARTNYYNSLYDHNLARARLKRALGSY